MRTLRAFRSLCYEGGGRAKADSSRREEFNRKNSIYWVNEIPVDVLFIGDSITESFEVQPYFGDLGNVVNRGIGGETVEALIKRWDLDVTLLSPKVCVMSEGINNTYSLYQQYEKGIEITEEMIDVKISEMRSCYEEIIEKCLKADVRLIVSSVLPLGVYDFRNRFILKLNEEIKKVCEERGVTYVDTYNIFTEEDGILMKDYTFGDKLHPHVLGYNALANTLRDYIERELKKANEK